MQNTLDFIFHGLFALEPHVQAAVNRFEYSDQQCSIRILLLFTNPRTHMKASIVTSAQISIFIRYFYSLVNLSLCFIGPVSWTSEFTDKIVRLFSARDLTVYLR